MRRSICLVFFILAFILAPLWAEQGEVIELSDDDIIEVPLGSVTPELAAQMPAMRQRLQALGANTAPLVLLMHVGYKSFDAPDGPDFECWETLDDFYIAGSRVYLGWVMANFEQTRSKVGVQIDVIGGKTITFKGKRAIPPLTMGAYFIRKTLANAPAIYEVTVSIGELGAGAPKPGIIFDSIVSRFVVNDVF